MPKTILATLSAVFLLVGGGALAIACDGGSSAWGNAGHDQYHEKPGCGPWKTDGWAGGSGYHDGQPPKDDNRGDCPKPPNCDQSHYSGYSPGGGGNDNNCCDNHQNSNYGSGGRKGDCNSSSADVSPVELSRT